MGKYVIRRLLQAIPVLFLVSIMVFVLLKLSGDPLAYMALDPTVSPEDRTYLRRSLGLDDPMMTQYVHWLIGDEWYQRDLDLDGEPDTYGDRQGVVRGDFGESIRYHRPVTKVVGEFLPNTLLLSGAALTLTIVLGVSVGMFAALHQYSLADHLITGLSFLSFSMPIFLVALLMVWFFSLTLQDWGLPHLPTQGMYDTRGDRSFDELLIHLILPTISLSTIGIARYTRFVRASMLEVISSDYIRTARAKGLRERHVIMRHALKNASIPIISLITIDIPFILSGAVVTETIFGWPGMGRLFIESLDTLDPPVLMVFVIMTAVAVILSQLLADVIYGWVDPRIRFDGSTA